MLNLQLRKQIAMLIDYTEQYSVIWESCSNQLHTFSKSYSNSEKLEKEIVLDQFLKSIKSFRKERTNRKSMSETEERMFFENTRRFLRDGLDFTNDQLEMMFSDVLYPYTDNLIDDPQISNVEKMIFSSRFRERLSGEKIEASNRTENAVFRLVEMIENQYSRNDFPELFASLSLFCLLPYSLMHRLMC